MNDPEQISNWQREAEIVAAVMAGESLKEAAQQTGVAPATARVLWLRARKKISGGA